MLSLHRCQSALARHRVPAIWLTFLVAVAVSPSIGSAQALTNTDSDAETTLNSSTANGAGPAGIIPYTKGFNLSLGTSSQHDSSDGWSSVLTPGAAYRLNRYFSANVSIPIYAYINVEVTGGTKLKPTYNLATKHGVLGDTTVAAHLDLYTIVDYNASVSLGLPSGNSNYGLGAGQPTFDINNHFEKSFGIFSPDIEVGFGDSASLVNRRILKGYTTVGYNAHFQAGLSMELPHNINFSADAYEQMPISTSTIHSTTTRGKKKVTTNTSVSGGEDNGFLTSLDIPVNRHVTLSGFYNRSLRGHDDVAGFSFTFLLKAAPREQDVR
jgi:outer membrane protein W